MTLYKTPTQDTMTHRMWNFVFVFALFSGACANAGTGTGDRVDAATGDIDSGANPLVDAAAGDIDSGVDPAVDAAPMAPDAAPVPDAAPAIDAAVDIPGTQPITGVYSSCLMPDECAELNPAVCLTVTSENVGICTAECNVPGDCPAAPGTGPGVAVPSCVDVSGTNYCALDCGQNTLTCPAGMMCIGQFADGSYRCY